MASAPIKYSTYAPGSAKGKSTISLKPGESLHYTAGKGYYAAPKPAAPAAPGYMYSGSAASDAARAPFYTPPPAPAPAPVPKPVAPPASQWGNMAAWTPAQIDAAAQAQADAGVDPQEAIIRQQQAQAAQQAQYQENTISELGQAGAKLQSEIAPVVGQQFSQATQDIGDISKGIGGQVGADLATSQAGLDAAAANQGQAQVAGVDIPSMQQTLGMLTGVIPGGQMAAQGMAETSWAEAQPAISLAATREDLAKAMQTAQQTNDGYAQQLIQIAATEPGLKAQALQQLNQYEVDKANYRQTVTQNNAQNALAVRQTHDQEVLNGITAQNKIAYDKATLSYKYAALNFQTQKAALAAKVAIAKANAQGRTVDDRLSEDKGYMVDHNGNPVLDGQGKRIPVKKAPTGAAVVTPAKKVAAMSKAKSSATVFARTLSKARTYVPAHANQEGKYVTAAQYKKYGYPDGSTDNPKRAARSGDLATAKQQMWNKIGGDALVATYGYSKEQVMGWINSALAATGWTQ